MRYDTARVELRTVGLEPLVELDGARYSVPPELVGLRVEVRVPVDAGALEVRSAGRVVAAHRLAGAGGTVWDPGHRAAAERIALTRHQRTGQRRDQRSDRPRQHLRAVPDEPTVALSQEGSDFDVAALDLADRYPGLDVTDGISR